jgi:hypothetical protein
VFLDKTFKSTYESGIFATIEGAATPSAGPFIERLREVMNGKYNIRDKFIVIASALAEVDADEDIKAFKQLNPASPTERVERRQATEIPRAPRGAIASNGRRRRRRKNEKQPRVRHAR